MKNKRMITASFLALSVLAGCNSASVQERMSDGQDALKAGNLRAATIEFKSLLQEHPELTDARIGLAKVAMAQRDFKSAATELERLGMLGDDGDLVRTLLARSYHNDNKDSALLSIDANGNDEILYYQLLRYLGPGDDSKIQEITNQMTPGSQFSQLANSAVSSLSKEVDLVVQQLPDPTNEKVFDSELYLLSSALHTQNGDIKKATDALARYHQLNPRDNMRRLQYAQNLVLLGDVEVAEDVLSPLIKAFPQHGFINQLHAQILFEQGDYTGAESASILATTADPNNVPARLVAAYSAAQLDKPNDALESLEFIIDRLPENHPAQRLYLRLKAMKGDLGGVAEKALALSDVQPGDREFLSALGLEALRSGDRKTAEALAEKAEVSGDEASTQLGILQLSLNQEEEAFSNLESAFEKAPTENFGANTLAAAYLAAERYDDALALSERWKKEGRLIEGLMLDGVVSARKGNHKKAQDSFESVLAEEPTHYMGRAGVIESLIYQGKEGQAKQKLSGWIGEEGMVNLFRTYVATKRMVEDDGIYNEPAEMLSNWVDSGKVTDPLAHYLLGQTYFLMQEYPSALSALEKMEPSEISSPAEYWLLKATASEMVNEREKALSVYRSWKTAEPQNPMPLLGEVRILSQSGENKKALSVLDGALPKLENPVPGQLLKGHLHLKLRQWIPLRDVVEQLPESARDSIAGRALIGALHLYDGENKDAVPLLSDYVKASGSDEFLRLLVAAIQSSEGAGAVTERLITHLEDYPDSVLANFLLANNLAQSGSYPKAAKYYEKVAAVGNNNAMFLNNYAYVLMKLGQLENATDLSKKAVAIAPKNPSYVDTLVEVLIASSRQDSAKAVVEQFIDAGGEPNAALKLKIEQLN